MCSCGPSCPKNASVPGWNQWPGADGFVVYFNRNAPPVSAAGISGGGNGIITARQLMGSGALPRRGSNWGPGPCPGEAGPAGTSPSANADGSAGISGATRRAPKARQQSGSGALPRWGPGQRPGGGYSAVKVRFRVSEKRSVTVSPARTKRRRPAFR